MDAEFNHHHKSFVLIGEIKFVWGCGDDGYNFLIIHADKVSQSSLRDTWTSDKQCVRVAQLLKK